MSKKDHKSKHKKLKFALLMIVLVVAVVYLFRGWVRSTFEPAALSFTVGHSVNTTLDKEMAALNGPFKTIGIDRTQRSNECKRTYAKGLHSEIDCSSTINGYSRLPHAQLADLAAKSAKLEKTLKANGWSGFNTSISTLGKNIGQGIDYTPDAAYQKTIGKTTCMADFNTAFSQPRPAAINGSISCSRAVYIWGSPATVEQRLQSIKNLNSLH